MNRTLLYLHYNKTDGLSEYVVYQLKKMRPLFSTLVFVTNSPLSIDDKKRLQHLYDTFIQRENVGFDFAAWRDGIRAVGWDKLAKFDSLTIMNDTCFGPIYPIEDVYKKMEATRADFWGITDYVASSTGMAVTNGPIPHHIQSYLEVFNNKVIVSEVFQNFWDSVQDYADVKEVIREYETQLTDTLANAGFTFKVYLDTQEYSQRNKIVDKYNYAELLPLVILENGVPLLKIKSFVHTSHQNLISKIKKTNYPVNLIENHLKIMQIVNKNTARMHIRNSLARRAKRLLGPTMSERIAQRKSKL